MTRVRHTGEARDEISARVAERYRTGASIRQLAEQFEMSYGKVHRLLGEAGVELRGRGGPRKRGLSRRQADEYRRQLGQPQ